MGRGGTLFFGGVNGFNYFHPANLARRARMALAHPPPVVVTAFTKMGATLALPQQGPIVLEHFDKFFSFDFAVLDYHNPSKNRYNYRLDPKVYLIDRLPVSVDPFEVSSSAQPALIQSSFPQLNLN